VRTLGAARWLLILGVLCLACGAGATIALAAPGHASRHRSSRNPRACRRAKHRHCPTTRARKRLTGKDRRRLASRSVKPKGAAKGSGSTPPWTTVPSAVGPGSTPGSSTAPSGTPPGESPTPPPAPARVQVTAEDSEAFRFVLSRPSVPAGRVIIEFVNHGQDEHNLNAIEPVEASVAGSIPDTAPNGHPTLTVDLRHGSYTLFCSLKEHEAKGMKATLVVN
jgi:plastocyanin